MIHLLNTPWTTLVDLTSKYPDHICIYNPCDSDTDGMSFDIFNENKSCFIFMKPKCSDLELVQRYCSNHGRSDNNHVIIWNASSSFSSKLESNNEVNIVSSDLSILKKDIYSQIKSRIKKVGIKANDSIYSSFSDILGSSDFSPSVNSDIIELRYRSLLLRCIEKKNISKNDVNEILGDDIGNEDSSCFVLYSKGYLDIFLHIFKEKMKDKFGYEKEAFIFKIINYFEHELRLKIMIHSMLNCGESDEAIIDGISKMKKKNTKRETYSKNQVKFFISKISSKNPDYIKKDNKFKLLAINSCRKIIRSDSASVFKDTYAMFLIMYLMDMVDFGNFYQVVSRLRV